MSKVSVAERSLAIPPICAASQPDRAAGKTQASLVGMLQLGWPAHANAISLVDA